MAWTLGAATAAADDALALWRRLSGLRPQCSSTCTRARPASSPRRTRGRARLRLARPGVPVVTDFRDLGVGQELLCRATSGLAETGCGLGRPLHAYRGAPARLPRALAGHGCGRRGRGCLGSVAGRVPARALGRARTLAGRAVWRGPSRVRGPPAPPGEQREGRPGGCGRGVPPGPRPGPFGGGWSRRPRPGRWRATQSGAGRGHGRRPPGPRVGRLLGSLGGAWGCGPPPGVVPGQETPPRPRSGCGRGGAASPSRTWPGGGPESFAAGAGRVGLRPARDGLDFSLVRAVLRPALMAPDRRGALLTLMAGDAVTAVRASHGNGPRPDVPALRGWWETIEHRLWQCPAWARAREEAAQAHGASAGALARALPPLTRHCLLWPSSPGLQAALAAAEATPLRLPARAPPGGPPGRVWTDGAACHAGVPVLARAALAVFFGPGDPRSAAGGVTGWRWPSTANWRPAFRLRAATRGPCWWSWTPSTSRGASRLWPYERVRPTPSTATCGLRCGRRGAASGLRRVGSRRTGCGRPPPSSRRKTGRGTRLRTRLRGLRWRGAGRPRTWSEEALTRERLAVAAACVGAAAHHAALVWAHQAGLRPGAGGLWPDGGSSVGARALPRCRLALGLWCPAGDSHRQRSQLGRPDYSTLREIAHDLYCRARQAALLPNSPRQLGRQLSRLITAEPRASAGR